MIDIVLRFADEESARYFVAFVEAAKSAQGTPAPLKCSLGASAVRAADCAILLSPLQQAFVPSRTIPAVK